MRKYWTEKEVKILRKVYPTGSIQKLEKIFDCGITKVYQKANALGIKKDPDYIRKVSLATQQTLIKEGRHTGFKKGNIPYNKGKKVPPETIEKIRRTWFERGEMPPNYKPVGTERIIKGGYVMVKTKDPRTWRLKHRLNWEKMFGKIPPRHIIVFKNKDYTDCRIENLEMITYEENIKRNTIQRYPKDLQHTLKVLSKLKKTIKKNA